MARVRVIMAGSGAEQGRMAEMIRSQGLEGHLKLAGSFPYEAVPLLYNAVNTFILPSIPVPFWQEQFGMVLVEAMASGLPVISTHSGSIPEVIGDAGALVQPNNPLSLYEEIKKLYTDRHYREALAVKGRERALEMFSIEKAAAGIEAVYQELL
jgi:glycosyltransferase involved in cell wall biosynthesis